MRTHQRIVRTKRGARILQDDVILSEILAKPGPTHGFFDILAAGVAALAPGPRFAMLGFAGGGVLGPLRAMGFPHPVEAVDLSRENEGLFRELSSGWAGRVALNVSDAAEFLRRPRAPYDIVLEDLSTPSPAGVVKPTVSFDPLPELIRARLSPGGVCVTNMLPLAGASWRSIEARLSRPYRCAVVVHVADYENRVLLAGDRLEGAPELSRRLRAALRAIGSGQASRIRLRTLFHAPSGRAGPQPT